MKHHCLQFIFFHRPCTTRPSSRIEVLHSLPSPGEQKIFSLNILPWFVPGAPTTGIALPTCCSRHQCHLHQVAPTTSWQPGGPQHMNSLAPCLCFFSRRSCISLSTRTWASSPSRRPSTTMGSTLAPSRGKPGRRCRWFTSALHVSFHSVFISFVVHLVTLGHSIISTLLYPVSLLRL